MNHFTNPFSKNSGRMAVGFLLVLGTLVFNSCKKSSPVINQTAFLSITNASPTLGTFNVYLNDSQVNQNGALSVGGGIAYTQLNAGDYDVKFTTASSIESLLTKNITLAANTVNSLFLINDSDHLDGLLITDDFSGQSVDKAFIRFINLSPDAPALDLAYTDSTTLITGKSYKAASEFITTDPKTYSFEVKDASGDVKASLNDVTFAAGIHYTIITTGMLTPGETDHPLRVQMITNQ